MVVTPSSTVEQDFNATLPESFEKKVMTTLLAEDLQDQKMMLRFYREWRMEERQEKEFLSAFLAFLEEKKEKEVDTQLLRNSMQLSQELIEEIQQMVDDFNEQYEQLQQEELAYNSYDEQLNEVDESLADSFDELFDKNTDFAQDSIKLSKEEQKSYLDSIEQFTQEQALIFAENHKFHIGMDVDIDIHKELSNFMNKMAQHLTESVEFNKAHVPQIKKMQVVNKIVGKPEQKHHQLQQEKFKLACKKAICVQKLSSLKADLASKEQNAIERIEHHSKANHTSSQQARR